MRPIRIEIAGFKGADVVAYDLTSPLVFITGRNGQGKSRIREALDFVLGRDVAGVSGAGKELRAALAGAELDVTLTVELDDGAIQTVRRARRVEKGTFKKPVVYIGGVEADESKVVNLLGDVSAPSGSAWLDLSEDKLLAELARLGARARAGRDSVLSAVRAVAAHNKGALAESLCAALGVKAPPRFVPPEDAPEDVAAAGYVARAADVLKGLDGCDAAKLLAQAREVAKAEVNDAQRALKAIEGSADRSREASVAAEVRPDEVALVEAQVKTADEAFRAAEAERVTAKNALDQGARPLADWQATKARLEAKVQGARNRLGALAVPASATAPKAEVEPLRAALTAAETYARGVATERDEAAKTEQSALFAWGQAENTTRGARAALKVLEGGHCPTCRQAITGDVRAVFDLALATAEQAEARAKSELDAAREYLADQRSELENAANDMAKARQALDAALGVQASEGRMAAARETYNAAKTALDEALAEQTEFLGKPAPAEPADAQARHNAALADAEAKLRELEQIRGRLTEVSGQVERYKRWRSDLKARTDAEARKKAADALMETVRTAERDLAKAGADELLGTAAMYLPPEFGEPLVFEGAVGIRKSGAFWSGPGLSNAQRLVLALSIDRALDAINGRMLRLVLVEAEALDNRTLDHVCAALEGDVEMGALDCAMLISCHEPPRLVPQWQRIHVGPQDPGPPGGGEPVPLITVKDVTPEQVESLKVALAEHNKNPGPVVLLPADVEYGRPVIEAAVDALAGAVGYVPSVGHVSALDLALEPRMAEMAEFRDSFVPAPLMRAEDFPAAEPETGIVVVTPDDEPDAYDEPGVWVCPDCQKDTGGLTHYCTASGEDVPVGGLSPEGAEVLASIVEADHTPVEETESAPADPPPQAEMPLAGVAPRVLPTTHVLLPDPAALDDQAALNALADVGLPVDGLKPAAARDILARRLKDDCPPAVVETTANAIRKYLPKVPPRGVADWLWRPGQTLGDSPSQSVIDAVINRLGARAVNELDTWPGGKFKPYEGGLIDDDVRDELERALLVVAGSNPPTLTPAGVKVWETLHNVTQPKSDAEVQRAAGAAVAMLDETGVTADEARAAIKGMPGDALKALGEDCAQLPKTANMTIGKRRDEIAARLARAGTKAAALADMVAKYTAAFPPTPKRLTKGAGSGDGAPDETNEVEAAVASEGE